MKQMVLVLLLDGSDQHPVYCRFDIACLAIVRIPETAVILEKIVSCPG